MAETESELLGLILSEWCRLTLMSPVQQPGEGWLDFRHRIEPLADLDRFGVKIDPRWIGADATGRQARRRALANLVEDGWIVLRSIHRRLTFALPTDLAIRAILDATTPPPPTPPPPQLLTTEEAERRDAATAAELDAILAADRVQLDKLLAELATTGSESPQ